MANQNRDTIGIASVVTDLVASGLASSTVTFQRFNGELDEQGTEAKDDDANWDEVEGLVDLQAMVAADIYMTNVTRSLERRVPGTIAESDSQHVLLTGLYKGIRKADRAVITRPNGVEVQTFDVLGVEWDSQAVMTRLEVRFYR